MQAAGKSYGKWSIWSSISETSGLITIDKPFIIIEDSKYVILLPEAVSETKRVDFPEIVFLIVSYCPYLKVVNPKISCISFYIFYFSYDWGSSYLSLLPYY